MKIWLARALAMLAIAALAACNAANNAQYQTPTRGGWDNFRADAASGRPVKAIVTILSTRDSENSHAELS
jgi:hypothetical protein